MSLGVIQLKRILIDRSWISSKSFRDLFMESRSLQMTRSSQILVGGFWCADYQAMVGL